MAEPFPRKKPGDDLEAEHVNRLSEIARKVSDGTETGYVVSEGGRSAGLMPFIQRPMVVTAEECDLDGDGTVPAAEQGRDEVRPRYYDQGDDTWKTDMDAGPYCLDTDAASILVEVDDIIVAFYDPQSGRFIPVSFACEAQNEIQYLNVFGSPTSGTIDLIVTVNSVTSTITLNWDSTAAQAKTQMETHAEIGSGDCDVTGGDLPNATLRFEFTNLLSNTAIPIMGTDITGFGAIGGLGAIMAREQKGRE